jgi:hypothetical protein
VLNVVAPLATWSLEYSDFPSNQTCTVDAAPFAVTRMATWCQAPSVMLAGVSRV